MNRVTILNLTSSTRDGKIFRVRSPSENLSRTPVSPFMKEIFSSRVFAVKLERSRKFKVEMGSEEKKECDGRVSGVGRELEYRVIRDRRSPENDVMSAKAYKINGSNNHLVDQCRVFPVQEEV